MKTKLLAFLILLAGVLDCPAPAPYIVKVGPPVSGDNQPMIQNAINAINLPSTLTTFSAIRVVLDQGIYYINEPLLFSNNWNTELTLEGYDNRGTAIVMNNVSNIVLETGSAVGVSPPFNNISLRLRNITLANSSNCCLPILFLTNVTTFVADDVNFVYWGSWTNNRSGANLYGPTWFSFLQGATNGNLVGIQAAYTSDYSIIHNCGFYGLACGIEASGFDHLDCSWNKFYACPHYQAYTNSWPLGSPFNGSSPNSANSAISMCLVGGLQNQDWTFNHNHFYGCNGCYLNGQPKSAATFNSAREHYNTTDLFESCNYPYLVTPANIWNALNSVGSSSSKMVSTTNYQIIDLPEPSRICIFNNINTRMQSTAGLISASGIQGLPVISQMTNIAGINITNCGTSAYNVGYTNPTPFTAVGGSSCIMFTNAQAQAAIVWEPNIFNDGTPINNAASFELWAGGVEIFGTEPFNQTWPITPFGQLQVGSPNVPFGSAYGVACFMGQQWFPTTQFFSQTVASPDWKFIYTNAISPGATSTFIVTNNLATLSTNSLAVTTAGVTNNTLTTYILSITAGSAMSMSNALTAAAGGIQIFTPVANGSYPLKPGWVFHGTTVTATAIAY